MDWLTITSAAKDIALAGAAIVTATVAYRGLRKWREELRGKVDFEVARSLARATYKLRDELRVARTPFVRATEFPPSYPGPQKATAQEEAQAWAHVYKHRWEPVAAAVQEFETQALEAEALWGATIREVTQALRKCAHKLSVSMETMIENAASGGKNFESDKAFGKQVRAEVSGLSTATENPLSNEIGAAVNAIETKLRGHLSRN
jgi:hypothetical protein